MSKPRALQTLYTLDQRELPRLLAGGGSRRLFREAAGEPGAGGRWLPSQVRRGFQALGVSPRGGVIAFINLKGGVGKTTCAVSLASRAVQLGLRTCVLDLDSQASASLALGVEADDDTAVFVDVWQKPAEMLPGSLYRLQEFFHLLPSSLENGLLDGSLTQPAALKTAASGACAVLRERGFDLVVLDCPPSLGPAVVSSVCAADTIVIPMGCDAFSLRGMELTLAEARSIRETFGQKPPRPRLLLCGVDRRIKMWEQVVKRLRAEHGDLLLPTIIRTSSELPRALARRRTVFAGLARRGVRRDFEAFCHHLLGIDGAAPEEESIA